MKFLFILIYSTLLCFNINGQNQTIYLNKKGEEITHKEFMKDVENSNWLYKQGETTYRKKNDSEKLQFFSGNYSIIKEKLEEITNVKYSDSTVFMLDYSPRNDMCHNIDDPNNWSREHTTRLKNFIKPKIRKLERHYQNMQAIYLIENGKNVNERGSRKRKIFFTDKNNFFKKKLFPISSFCGHNAIIKPDGSILIYNGENDILWIANYSKPEIWNSIFEKK